MSFPIMRVRLRGKSAGLTSGPRLVRSRGVAPRRRSRPILTVLEDRRLLSTYDVTSTADDGSTGTLRWAIAQANSATGASAIDFQLGTAAATITLGDGQLELTNTKVPTTIYDGVGQGPLTISGNSAGRVFLIDANVTATLSGLTITAGLAAGDYGGGLEDLGTTTVNDCAITGNSATYGGGLYIATNATATLTDCVISGNLSSASGGSPGDGGGIDNSGTATLTDCTIGGNSALCRRAGQRRNSRRRGDLDAHRLHDQRQLGHDLGWPGKLCERPGHTHRLHHQRKYGGRSRGSFERWWNSDSHGLHRQR